jgi:hypothetical protein
MSNAIRWTVRGIKQSTIDMIAEVRETSGGSYGELINEAVETWYDSLPEATDDEACLDGSRE